MPAINFPTSWCLTLPSEWQQDSSDQNKLSRPSADGNRTIILRLYTLPAVHTSSQEESYIANLTSGYVLISSSSKSQLWKGATQATAGARYIFRLIQPGEFPASILYLTLANVEEPDDNPIVTAVVAAVEAWTRNS